MQRWEKRSSGQCAVVRLQGQVQTPTKKKSTSTHNITTSELPEPVPSLDEPMANNVSSYDMFSLAGQAKPIMLPVKLQDNLIQMELDTGAALSIIGEATYQEIFGKDHQLDSTNITLRLYNGQELLVLGTTDVQVKYEGQTATLPLVVVQGAGASLFRRNWLDHICVNLGAVHLLQARPKFEHLMKQHAPLFSDKWGLLKVTTAKIYVPIDARPRFFKPRRVLYSLKEKVEQELDHLQEDGTIEPVTYAEWAALIVPILKADGKIRICSDYRVTVNQVATPDIYPLPQIEDFFASLSSGMIFSKLDLHYAYQQVEVDEMYHDQYDKRIVSISSLTFGISAAPAIFQRLMETLLQHLPHVAVYLDDILVTGVDKDDHRAKLDKVMSQLKLAGLTLRQSKCVFGASSIEYLGHVIDADGLHPSPEKVRAIINAPEPTSNAELRSCLGLLNYYNKFLPNLSMLRIPGHLTTGLHSSKQRNSCSHPHSWSTMIA